MTIRVQDNTSFVSYGTAIITACILLLMLLNFLSNNSHMYSYYENAGMETVVNYQLTSKPKRMCQTKEEFVNGQWLDSGVSLTTLKKAYNDTSPLRCQRNGRNKPLSYYTWKPDADCLLLPDVHEVTQKISANNSFSSRLSDSFCNVLQEKNISRIALAGDSITYEQFNALLFILRLPIQGHNEQLRSKKFKTPINMKFMCPNQHAVLLSYLRDDHLQYIDTLLFQKLEMLPDVLILNQGAHYQPDNLLIAGLEKLSQTVAKYQLKCSECKFFWRTTWPGIPNCWGSFAPENNLTLMEEQITNRSWYEENEKTDFYWWDFKHQNQIAISFWQNYSESMSSSLSSLQNNVTILPGYELMVRRPDQHNKPNDCLHSCAPIAPIVMIRILLNLLQL